MIAWGGRRLWHRCQNVCLWNFCRYIWRRCCWAVEDYAPGHPHEAWGLKSSRRGNLCAVLVCVSTQGYTMTIVCCNCCVLFRLFLFWYSRLRFWFSYCDTPEYNMLLRFKQFCGSFWYFFLWCAFLLCFFSYFESRARLTNHVSCGDTTRCCRPVLMALIEVPVT